MKTIIKKNLKVAAFCKPGVQYTSEYVKLLRAHARELHIMNRVHFLTYLVYTNRNISEFCRRRGIKHHYSTSEIMELERRYFGRNVEEYTHFFQERI